GPLGREDAGKRVGIAAGSEADEDSHRLLRPLLRRRGARARRNGYPEDQRKAVHASSCQTSAWMRSRFGIVSGGLRPKPHSVAIPKPLACFSAAAIRRCVPVAPSESCTRPRKSLVRWFSSRPSSGAK